MPFSVSLKSVNSSMKRQTLPFGDLGLMSSRFFLTQFLRVVLYINGIDLFWANPATLLRIEEKN